MAKPRGLFTPVYRSLVMHPKVGRAALDLHSDRYKLVGHLIALWTWCLDSVPTTGGPITAVDVILASGWNPRRGTAFVNALAACGFLDAVEGGYAIHNWPDYGGKVAALQEYDRKRHIPGSSGEVRRSFPGNSPLDDTRRDQTRLQDPDAPATRARPFSTSRAVDDPPGTEAEAVYRALVELRLACVDGDVPRQIEATLHTWADILTLADVQGIEGEVDGRHRWNLVATIIGSWAADRKRGDDPAAVRAADRARVAGGGANGGTPRSRGVATGRSGRFTTPEQEAAEYGPGTVGHF